jgi:hypothetical protein
MRGRLEIGHVRQDWALGRRRQPQGHAQFFWASMRRQLREQLTAIARLGDAISPRGRSMHAARNRRDRARGRCVPDRGLTRVRRRDWLD